METSEVIENKIATPVLSATLRYGDLEVEFSGTPEQVGRSINDFLAKEVPGYSLAQKLSLKYSASELVQNFSEHVRITNEGPVIIDSGKKLSDWQVVALRLVAQEIAFETGSASFASLTLSEIQNSLSLKPKTISSRLSELIKAGNVAREEKNGATAFRITTLGVSSLSENLRSKRARISGSS